jgi:hypothetical protein
MFKREFAHLVEVIVRFFRGMPPVAVVVELACKARDKEPQLSTTSMHSTKVIRCFEQPNQAGRPLALPRSPAAETATKVRRARRQSTNNDTAESETLLSNPDPILM